MENCFPKTNTNIKKMGFLDKIKPKTKSGTSQKSEQKESELGTTVNEKVKG